MDLSGLLVELIATPRPITGQDVRCQPPARSPGRSAGAWASRCSAVLITGRPATVEAWWPVTVVPPGLGALVGPGPQAAQQDSFETSVRKDWAAIFTPSAIVRYGHHKVATWSTVIPADKM